MQSVENDEIFENDKLQNRNLIEWITCESGDLLTIPVKRGFFPQFFCFDFVPFTHTYKKKFSRKKLPLSI